MHILRVATVYEPKVDTLPQEFCDVLTVDDIEAILTGPKHFDKIASEDSPKWLREILAECAGSFYELQFYSSGDSPYRPYFRFHSQGHPAVSLPRRTVLRHDMPSLLRDVYGIIGAFRENGFDEAGGLHPGDELIPVSEMGIAVHDDSSLNPVEAIPFLETYAGSQLCYLPDGSGAWLEACRFRQVESLEQEMARYFEALLRGTRI
jgi:hypothetical protein